MRAAESDLSECARIIREGSKSFHAASLLLPQDVRVAARALYAFCRVADDKVDDGADPSAALKLLTARLDAAYAGRPWDSPVDRSFAWVTGAYAIPKAVPQALLEGFAWDVAGRRYETFDDLVAYAIRVAGTVGVMMALVMGERRPEVLARAMDLGIGMQLTNIARDIGEDARHGRFYVPQAWLREAGVTEMALASAETACPRHKALTRRLLAEAERFYAAGTAGIAFLPAGCRPAIRAAALIYRDIGRSIVRNGHDSISRRAYVTSRRKLALLARASFAHAEQLPAQALAVPSGRFLIEAVSARPPQQPSHPAMNGGWPWVMNLFLDLESRSVPARDRRRRLRA
ncbi:MAG: phytoene/squalene synthase family protein [Hyphomonas sp.]